MVKRFKIIIFSIITLLILTSNNIYAAEPELQITGDSQGKAGETKTLIIKLVSDEDMGVISGKVSSDSNIENIEIEGKNNWNLLAYENGSFKLVKTAGGKNEDVFEITYTIKESANEDVNIMLSNLELTTLEYETKTIDDISKKITVKSENNDNANIVNTSNTTNTNNTANKIEINNQATNNNNSQNKITNITSTTNKITNKDTTVANKVLADAGTTNIIRYVILGIIGIGFIFYVKYKKI